MKPGDKVKAITGGQHDGLEGVISRKYDGQQAWYVRFIDGREEGYMEYNLQIINKNMSINLKEKFALALTKEPMKTFRKAGITNGDNLLTEEGVTIFLSWLLDTKYAVEFKKDIVDGMLKDQEEEEDKK